MYEEGIGSNITLCGRGVLHSFHCELSLCLCFKEVSSIFNFLDGFEGGEFLYLAFFFFFYWKS